jgi:hypothetical protein
MEIDFNVVPDWLTQAKGGAYNPAIIWPGNAAAFA